MSSLNQNRLQAMFSHFPQGKQITEIVALANEPEPTDEAKRLRWMEAVKIKNEYVRVSNLSRWRQIGELWRFFTLTEEFGKYYPATPR